MRAAILGCGSIGGTVAVRTARRLPLRDPGRRAHGPGPVELAVIDRDPRIHERWLAHGLTLRIGGRTFSRRPPFFSTLEEAASRGPFDLILLTTKSTGLMALAEQAIGRLSERGFLVTVQNGLIALELSRRFGAHRVLPGCVLWGASMNQPGSYELTARGPFIIGQLRGPDAPPAPPDRGSAWRVEQAARFLSLSFPVRRSADMQGVLWSKLAITASLTSLGAVTGRRFGALVANPRIRRLILAVGAEVGRTAHANGIALQPLSPLLDMERFVSDQYPATLKHLLMLAVGLKHRKTRSAMLASLEAGETTEVEQINATVVRMAARKEVAVPVNERIVQLVHDLERGRIRPADRLLERLTP